MNKKLIAIVLIFLLGLFLFNACTSSSTTSANQQNSGNANPPTIQNQQKVPSGNIPQPPSFPE